MRAPSITSLYGCLCAGLAAALMGAPRAQPVSGDGPTPVPRSTAVATGTLASRAYKTSSADHIEGGVGGSIDLRTRHPFDFDGREIVVSTRVIHGDLARRSEPQLSALLSQRWKTRTAGEWGVLLNLSHQRRAW